MSLNWTGNMNENENENEDGDEAEVEDGDEAEVEVEGEDEDENWGKRLTCSMSLQRDVDGPGLDRLN